MTLGQRIQQLRKEQGLSQEALGEQLGVSRQAISKWESDITIPEIDKLIALSKLFGVSVGTLLGVEEDDPAAPAAEELTDRELLAIEAIVGRYLEKAERQKPKRKIWPAVLGIIIALLLIFWMKEKMEYLSDRIIYLQGDVNSISSNVNNQINSMSEQIKDILEEEANLLADYSYEVTDVNISAGTITLDVSATPKTYIDRMEMYFIAEPAGEEPITAPAETTGPTFQIVGWVLPLNDDLKLSVTFGADGNWMTQVIEVLRDWKRSSQLHLDLERGGSAHLSMTTKEQGYWTVVWSLNGYFATFVEAGLKPETAELQLSKNGVVLQSMSLNLIDKNETVYFEVENFEETTSIVAGDVLEYGISYTDNYGRELFYSIECVEFQEVKPGQLQEVFVAAADVYGSVYNAVYG